MEKLPTIAHCIRRLATSTSIASSSFQQYNYGAVQYAQSRMAGHSHWANVRHIKGAKDKEKMLVSQIIAGKIRSALREPGGANPNVNMALAKVVEYAKTKNIPTKTIQGLISKADSLKLTPITVEAKGPNGSLLILDISTPNHRKTRNDLSRLFAKRGGSVMTEGGTRNSFERKGVIMATPKDSNSMSLEEATDIAIMVNAEDVQESKSEDDTPCFEITCEPDLIYQVLKGLNETSLAVSEYSVKPLPLDLVELSDEDKSTVEDIVEAVQRYEEIVIENIHDNIRW